MRKILFRGKRPINGAWVYGDLVQIPSQENWYGISLQKPSKDVYTVESKTVGQYTGMTDKNGKKIFEGDIVQYYDTIEGNICTPEIVIFGDSGWQTKSIKCYVADELNPRVAKDYKVIGNIYDNPELLKE